MILIAELFREGKRLPEYNAGAQPTLLSAARGSNLARFVFQIPLLHPPHAEQICDPDERAVAKAVLRGTCKARRVFDRLLAHCVAAHLDQRRKISMRAAEELQSLDGMRAINFQTAGGIVHRLLRYPVADAIRLAALPAAKRGILPLFSPAGDH